MKFRKPKQYELQNVIDVLEHNRLVEVLKAMAVKYLNGTPFTVELESESQYDDEGGYYFSLQYIRFYDEHDDELPLNEETQKLADDEEWETATWLVSGNDGENADELEYDGSGETIDLTQGPKPLPCSVWIHEGEDE